MNPVRKLFFKRKRAYQALFREEEGHLNENMKIVMADLRKFCFGTGSSFSTDPLTLARNEGRREVLERIRSYVHITEDELFRMTETLEIDNDN